MLTPRTDFQEAFYLSNEFRCMTPSKIDPGSQLKLNEQGKCDLSPRLWFCALGWAFRAVFEINRSKSAPVKVKPAPSKTHEAFQALRSREYPVPGMDSYAVLLSAKYSLVARPDAMRVLDMIALPSLTPFIFLGNGAYQWSELQSLRPRNHDYRCVVCELCCTWCCRSHYQPPGEKVAHAERPSTPAWSCGIASDREYVAEFFVYLFLFLPLFHLTFRYSGYAYLQIRPYILQMGRKIRSFDMVYRPRTDNPYHQRVRGGQRDIGETWNYLCRSPTARHGWRTCRYALKIDYQFFRATDIRNTDTRHG